MPFFHGYSGLDTENSVRLAHVVAEHVHVSDIVL